VNRILWRASRRYLISHPWQPGLAALGVALGVAVVVAINLAEASAKRAFTLSTEMVIGKATHQIIGGPAGVDEALYVQLRRNEGIQPAAPVVEGYVYVPGDPGRTLKLLGVDPFEEPPFRPYWQHFGRGSEIDVARLVTQPNTALLGTATAREIGLKPGDTLKLRIGAEPAAVQIISFITSGNGAPNAGLDDLLITDISTAQALLRIPGRLSRVDLILPTGRQGNATVKKLRAMLPPDLELVSTGIRTQAVQQMTHAFQTNLTALSLLALFVGMFLIYNTMTFVVIQRRELIGNLRALGVMRREIFQLILVEALFIGLVGTLCGLLLGIVLSHGLLRLVTQTINDLYFVITVRQLAVPPFTLAAAVLLGLGVTVLAAWVPAYEAASVPPRVAMNRSLIETKVRHLVKHSALSGLLVVAFGTAALLLPSQSLALGFAGLFALLLGATLLSPAATVGLVRLCQPAFSRVFGLVGRLAARSVLASLSRTAVAVAALMVAVSVALSVGIMIASFRLSVADWLETVLRADLYVSLPRPVASPPQGNMPPALVERISSAPGVADSSTVRRAHIESKHGITEIVAYKLSPRSYAGFRFKDGDADVIWPAFEDQEAVLISEPYSYHHGLGVDSILRLRTDKGERGFRIAGVYYDYGSDQGVVAMSHRTYELYWNDQNVSGIGIYLNPGTTLSDMKDVLHRVAGPHQELQIVSSRKIREASLEIFDRTFAITEVLRFLTALIAFVAVFSALMSLQLERTREFGVLRAIGLTPPQLWGLILSQTGLMGLVAGLLALPVGIVLALALIFVINQRSFGWTMDVYVSSGILVQSMVMALAAAILAGIYPAFKMARARPAEMLRQE